MFWNLWDLVWTVIGAWSMDKMSVTATALPAPAIMLDPISKTTVTRAQRGGGRKDRNSLLVRLVEDHCPCVDAGLCESTQHVDDD